MVVLDDPAAATGEAQGQPARLLRTSGLGGVERG